MNPVGYKQEFVNDSYMYVEVSTNAPTLFDMPIYIWLIILHQGVIINGRILARTTSVYGGDCALGQGDDLYERQQVQITHSDPMQNHCLIYTSYECSKCNSDRVTHHNQLFLLKHCNKSFKQCKIMVSANQTTGLQCKISSANHGVVECPF